MGAFTYVDTFKDSFMQIVEDKLENRSIELTKLSDIGAFCSDEAELVAINRFWHNEEKMLQVLLPHHHIILATSKTNVTAENANLACSSAKINRQFQEQELEGNLRSSPSISHLTKRYQLLDTRTREDQESFFFTLKVP